MSDFFSQQVSKAVTGASVAIPIFPAIGTLASLQLGISGGTITASVEITMDDPASGSAVWTPHADLTSKTASAHAVVSFPIRGARVNVASITAGAATLTALVVR